VQHTPRVEKVCALIVTVRAWSSYLPGGERHVICIQGMHGDGSHDDPQTTGHRVRSINEAGNKGRRRPGPLSEHPHGFQTMDLGNTEKMVELSGYCPPSPGRLTGAFYRLSFGFFLFDRTPQSAA
jgi:hypothetical protein